MHKFLQFLILFIIVVFIPAGIYSGTTGKLAGKATDVETGEALIGVNIMIDGLKAGTSTDINGNYFILQIPPGKYTVKVSAVGYKTTVYENIIIRADQTTTLNIQMKSAPVVGEEVTVLAKRPMVETNVTSTERSMTTEEIQSLPKMQRPQELVAIQPGAVGSGDNIHLRGGRAGELLYIVDGIPVRDILRSGASGLNVSNDVIQELSVLSGGFNAEYGDAQSGIVNIVTKSGGEKFNAMIQYKQDNLGFKKYFGENYLSFTIGGPEPITQKLLPMLKLNLPGRLSFFYSFDVDQTNTSNQYASSFYRNFPVRNVSLLGGLLKFNYTDKQSNTYTSNIKLKYDIGNYYINISYRISGERYHNYENMWKYKMDSAHVTNYSASQFTFRWNHSIDEKTFYTVDFGRVDRLMHQSVAGLTPDEYNHPLGYSYTTDINGDGFSDYCSGMLWRDEPTSVTTLKADLTSQLHKDHLLKTGFEFRYEEVKSIDIQYPYYFANRENLPGPYTSFGLYRFILNNYPNNGTAYIQDKIEMEGMLINVGLRYDYFAPGQQVRDSAFVKAFKEATVILDEKGDTVYNPVVWQGQFSPRLGISHNLTDKTVMYFNYGHFFQLPERNLYFRDPFTANGWVGNPNLKPPKTVSYEFGFDHSFTDDIALGVKGFYKDYFDYVGQTRVGTAANPLYMFVNIDYASAKGFEITFKKRYSENYSIDFNYTYQITKGRSESPYAAYYSELNNGTGLLPREVRLPWDQEHTINIFASYQVPENTDFSIFGIPFINDWNITILGRYGSGFPYTPAGKNSVYLKNTKTSPFTSTIDLKFEKRFTLFRNVSLAVFTDVTNLLDRRNISVDNNNSPRLNTVTGEAFKYGDITDPTTNIIIPWRLATSGLSPINFDPGRQIMIGIKLLFQ
jgi:outer membrane receptor protein involved in Fe transport